MALKRFRAAPLPIPPATYDSQYMRQLLRVLEIYHGQLDSKTPNFAESYEADVFAGGEFREGIATLSSNGPIPPGVSVVLSNAASGAVTLTLPPADESAGRRLAIKKTDASANAVTIDGSGAETIDGSATLVLATQYNATTIICDGSQWWVL